MSIPLVQNNEKDSINTSIIAIKRNIERINMLLGLSNSEEIDTSKFATKEELQQAVTDLQPVDEVALDNMQSVSSNAVAEALGGSRIKTYSFAFTLTKSQADVGWGWAKVSLPSEIINDNIIGVFVYTGAIANSKSAFINVCWANGADSYITYLTPYSIMESMSFNIKITYVV